jgi:hypothetical protein
MNAKRTGRSAIAQSLGYESESAFGKAFRRVMGCSPGQYTRSTALSAIPIKHGAEVHEQELGRTLWCVAKFDVFRQNSPKIVILSGAPHRFIA